MGNGNPWQYDWQNQYSTQPVGPNGVPTGTQTLQDPVAMRPVLGNLDASALEQALQRQQGGGGGSMWDQILQNLQKAISDPSGTWNRSRLGQGWNQAAPGIQAGWRNAFDVPGAWQQIQRDLAGRQTQGMPNNGGPPPPVNGANGPAGVAGPVRLPIAYQGGPDYQHPGNPWAAYQGPNYFQNSRQRLYGMQGPPVQPTQPQWYENPMWQYSQGGPGPLNGVPQEYWADQLTQLQASLPWAQMSQQERRAAWEQQMAGRQFDSAQGQQAWERAMAERNANAGDARTGFDQWLAQQQLALQAGNAGADNSWRNRQLDLQAQAQNWQQGYQGADWNRAGQQWDAQFGANRQDAAWQQAFQGADWQRAGDQWNAQFGANQAQQGWQNQFQQNDWNRAGQQWDSQFGANRADRAWDQQFQQNDWNRAGNQWDSQFNANRLDTAWNQQFQTQDWNRAGQQWQSQFDANRADQAQGQQNWDLSRSDNRADTAWNQQFQTQDWNRSGDQWNAQFGEDTRRFDVSQAFTEAQAAWQKQEAEKNRDLAEQQMWVGSFGRKFGPAIGNL